MGEQVRFAGKTPLLNLFRDGAVLALRSRAAGSHLRIMDGQVQGTGGTGKYGQFTIDVRGEGIVRLRSVADPRLYIRVMNNKLDIGGGGHWCEFKLHENDGHVCFEAKSCPGQYIGVKPNGDLKPPPDTGGGQHGQFLPIVISEGEACILPGTEGPLRNLAHGNVVVLKASSGNYLRRFDSGEVKGDGGRGVLAQWTVHVRGPGVVALQNVKNPEVYLRIMNNKLEGGAAGHFCEFNVQVHGGKVTFESVRNPNHRVGVRPNGEIKPPNETGNGQHGQFEPEVIKVQPEYNRAGDTPAQRTLYHMNKVLLYSAASKNTVRIQDNRVNGKGGEGVLAQFIVQVRAPGVVAFRNVANPNQYLDPTGDTLDTCPGHHAADVRVTEHDGRLVFESVPQPGSRIGILPNGDTKPPKNTGGGLHGQFSPKIVEHVDIIYT